MPTHQLISPTRCTRSHETSRNELNLTGPSRNPANIIYETKPIPSHQHRRPLPPNTRQHEIPNEPNFARNRLQTKPIRLPKRTQFHPHPTAMPPRYRQALLRHLLYWHFPCSESASRLPPLVSCTSAARARSSLTGCTPAATRSEEHTSELQ